MGSIPCVGKGEVCPGVNDMSILGVGNGVRAWKTPIGTIPPRPTSCIPAAASPAWRRAPARRASRPLAHGASGKPAARRPDRIGAGCARRRARGSRIRWPPGTVRQSPFRVLMDRAPLHLPLASARPLDVAGALCRRRTRWHPACLEGNMDATGFHCGIGFDTAFDQCAFRTMGYELR